MVLRELAVRGIPARATDLGSPRNRRIAARLGCRDVVFADLRALDFEPLLEGARAVIHLGAVLPPVTEDAPALGHDINVKPTLRLIEAIGRATGVQTRSATYRTHAAGGRLERYEIVLPVSGSYSQLRDFMKRSLAEKIGDVAYMILFLVSDESASCTGTDFLVDGGNLSGTRIKGEPGA